MSEDESLVGGGADELWDIARDQMGRGSFNTAASAFDSFLLEYPERRR